MGFGTPALSMAHPGHGNGNPLSPGHYVTSPEHAIQITLATAVVVIVVNWLLYRKATTQKNK